MKTMEVAGVRTAEKIANIDLVLTFMDLRKKILGNLCSKFTNNYP